VATYFVANAILIESSAVKRDSVCLLAAERLLTIHLSHNKNTPKRVKVFKGYASPLLAIATNIYFSFNRFYFTINSSTFSLSPSSLKEESRTFSHREPRCNLSSSVTSFIVFEQLRSKLERSTFNLWGYNNNTETVITQRQLA